MADERTCEVGAKIAHLILSDNAVWYEIVEKYATTLRNFLYSERNKKCFILLGFDLRTTFIRVQ